MLNICEDAKNDLTYFLLQATHPTCLGTALGETDRFVSSLPPDRSAPFAKIVSTNICIEPLSGIATTLGVAPSLVSEETFRHLQEGQKKTTQELQPLQSWHHGYSRDLFQALLLGHTLTYAAIEVLTSDQSPETLRKMLLFYLHPEGDQYEQIHLTPERIAERLTTLVRVMNELQGAHSIIPLLMHEDDKVARG